MDPIVVNNVTWNLARDQVALAPLEARLSQEQIAAEDEAEARQREKLEDHTGAQISYARAIIEYEACGWTEVRLAPLRVNRAGMLLALKQDAEAASELDRAARAFEAQAYHPSNRMVGDHLDYAEQAVDALVPLAMIYLHRTQDAIQARRVLERLLSLNALIKKRYERKVDLLLSIAECFLALGEQLEALNYFEQANRFYAQQLAPIADFSYVRPITKHLKEVKGRLAAVKQQSRTVRFTVTTKTPDDLETVLQQLQQGRLKVEVTKGVTPQRTSKDARSGLVYVANLRITLDPEEHSTK
jgi:tetratricopeptide (TPR) repeat protein